MASNKARLAYVFGGENFSCWNSAAGPKKVEVIDKDSVDKAIAEGKLMLELDQRAQKMLDSITT